MQGNTTFKQYFGIAQNEQVEFFDIPLDADKEAFICPFLIVNNSSSGSYRAAKEQMEAFLRKLNRNFVSSNDRSGGLSFLSLLHEPNEYHLGYSSTNQGKAISTPRAEVIFNALRNNRFSRGGSTITNEAHNVLLLVDGIGQDIMSDVIANVCRNIFAEFTTRQCKVHSIPTSLCAMHYFDKATNEWSSREFQLPMYSNRPVILIPKKLMSGSRAYTNFYNWFIAKNHLAIEILNGSLTHTNLRLLVRSLKGGTQKAIIKAIYKIYRKPKRDLIDFVLRYNGSLLEFQLYAKDHYPELDFGTSQ